ncbi:MAG: HD domain-containing protein [Candidatus Aminicenantes bacterium]|nr:HD domain-containing protein [Candidatus Aminicenantes bacterium]
MKIEAVFLRSKVAKRIFLLFVACAIVPITALAIVTFLNISHQLRKQGESELLQLSKSTGMAIFERLLLAEAEMRMISENLERDTFSSPPLAVLDAKDDPSTRFRGLAVQIEGKRTFFPYERSFEIPALESDKIQEIFQGETLILTQQKMEKKSHVFMASLLKLENPSEGILIVEIDPTYLWYFGYEDSLPPQIELSILDNSFNILYSSHPEGERLSDVMISRAKNGSQGLFDWKTGQGTHLAGYRSIFLQSRFYARDWIVVLTKSKTAMLAPLSYFKLTYPPIILITLWIVLLLSVNQIRRSLVPLEKIKEGTKHIANRNFESRIEVNSHDEFEDVARSFNTMAYQLGRQFNTLTAMVDIDRAILSALDTDKIITAVLSRMSQIFPCKSVCISLLDPMNAFSLTTYVGSTNPHFIIHQESGSITSEEIQQLTNNPETMVFLPGEKLPQYLIPMKNEALESFVALPLFIQNNLHGIISLGFKEEPALNREDAHQARQLADQVAVALSNAKLIDELNQLSWGTLTALARAIDAKSPWTAGHSENVTKIAMKIGKALGYSPYELEVLHRGGLLHDIGKIGVAPEILDKPTKLNEQEADSMRKHVLLGAKILEPISAYKEIISIIREHHENYDGSGYPFGLAGEEICQAARVIAVADRFEAMTSNRPYRKSLDQQSAAKIIEQNAGKEFDPRVVKAFLRILSGYKKRG